MTAAAIPAGIVSPGPAWRSLLWLIPLTVLWIVLIDWQPFIPASGVPTSAHQLMAHGLIAVGLWLGLESTDLTPSQRRTTWLAVMIPDTLWFAVAWSMAINGAFITGASLLPLLPLAIFLPVIIGAPLLLLSKRMGQVLDTMPASWLVALQLYRVFGNWPSLPGCVGRCRAGSRCRRDLAMCSPACSPYRRRSPDWHGSGPKGRNDLEYLRPGRLRRCDHLGHGHLARPVPADRSEFAEHRRRGLSECADPGLRGAKLDPAARAVAAPVAPARPSGGGAALDAQA